MTLNASQIINNMERSFNVYLEDALGEENINFNEDPYETGGLESWYAVRYSGYASESTGMGDLIDEDTDVKGRFHSLKCEVSAWRRDDPQRTELGAMVDELLSLCEAESVEFYDFADPEDPQLIGTMKVRPGRGSFTPSWGGGKSGSGTHIEANMVGFVLEVELIAIAQIS
jgi:hypothetical protein